MPEDIAVKTVEKSRTTAEILADSGARELIEEIFSDLHPGFINQTQEISSIFTPQAASTFLKQLMDFAALLKEEDSYETTVKKVQGQIDRAEAMRDDLLAQVFEQIRPIERSYRELMLFFENSKVQDGKVRKPVELYVINADPKAINDEFSVTIAAVEGFVRRRNDNFNFRDDICNLVIPGYVPSRVREKMEKIANTWGMLLIGDIDDEKTFKHVENNFRAGGKYEFLKRPEDSAAADVITMGYLQLRPAHWFEQSRKVESGDDLFGPPSLVFAGAIARADDSQGMAQGPVGSRFGQIAGSEKCRIEPLIGEMEHLSMERQLVPIIRDADNHLCFFGCRTQADDPYGVLKFFTSYRILRYVERCCRHYLLQVAGQVLTRDFMDDQIEKPLRRLLDEQKEQGTIIDYKLDVDKDSQKRMQGICDINLEVMPTGPAETFVLKIDVPEFSKGEAGKN